MSLAESGREGAGSDGGVSVWMEDKLANAAVELFERHGDDLPWIAVTNGRLPAYLFSREFLEKDSTLSSFWRCGAVGVYGAVSVYERGGGGGRAHFFIALVILPLTTHPFQDGVQFRTTPIRDTSNISALNMKGRRGGGRAFHLHIFDRIGFRTVLVSTRLRW